MWLKKEAPEFYKAQQSYVEFLEFLQGRTEHLSDGRIVLKRPDFTIELSKTYLDLKQQLYDKLKAVSPPAAAVRRFRDRVELDLQDTRLSHISVYSEFEVERNIASFEDWFLRVEFQSEAFSDTHVKNVILNHELFEAALRC